ncbi:MAG: hypothetical protein C4278_01100 [Patescibacteria group bacterium]
MKDYLRLEKKKFFFLFFLIIFLLYFKFEIFGAGNVQITAFVKGVCGNNIKEPGEECDGGDLGGQNCVSLGYFGGTLTCNPNCTFNTSRCFVSPPSGGGGGGFFPYQQTGDVIISGLAAPGSEITILSDGIIKATTRAERDGKWQIRLTNLNPGSYLFSVYGEDKKGLRTNLFTFPTFVSAGSTINITGVFLSPTIDVDKTDVKKGEDISIFGFSVPNSEILINISSENEIFSKVYADEQGGYFYSLNTADLEIGEHLTKSKSTYKEKSLVITSPYSRAVAFKVGEKTILKKPAVCNIKADLNNDCRVNLVDFSIMAYCYKRKLTEKCKRADLNNDGKVNLSDFSILAYWWTG